MTTCKLMLVEKFMRCHATYKLIKVFLTTLVIFTRNCIPDRDRQRAVFFLVRGTKRARIHMRTEGARRERVTSCKGAHTINTANVGSKRSDQPKWNVDGKHTKKVMRPTHISLALAVRAVSFFFFGCRPLFSRLASRRSLTRVANWRKKETARSLVK